MNFIVYNETTGRIEQTGWSEWDKPSYSTEYLRVSKNLKDLLVFVNKTQKNLDNLTLQNDPSLSSEIAVLTSLLATSALEKEELTTTKTALQESFNLEYKAAKDSFLASLQKEGYLAMEGEADLERQKVRLSDKTLIDRDPDPILYETANRSLRDSLLTRCDWTQAADSPLSTSAKQEWQVYRAALRSLPETVDTFNTAYLEPSDLPQKP